VMLRCNRYASDDATYMQTSVQALTNAGFTKSANSADNGNAWAGGTAQPCSPDYNDGQWPVYEKSVPAGTIFTATINQNANWVTFVKEHQAPTPAPTPAPALQLSSLTGFCAGQPVVEMKNGINMFAVSYNCNAHPTLVGCLKIRNLPVAYEGALMVKMSWDKSGQFGFTTHQAADIFVYIHCRAYEHYGPDAQNDWTTYVENEMAHQGFSAMPLGIEGVCPDSYTKKPTGTVFRKRFDEGSVVSITISRNVHWTVFAKLRTQAPTPAPTPAPVSWHMGTNGQSCDTVCEAHSETCDVQEMRDLVNRHITDTAVASRYVGTTCTHSRNAGSVGVVPLVVSNNDCRMYRDNNAAADTTCAASQAGTARLCACRPQA